MREFVLRPKAVSDLEEIWQYTVTVWDEDQAERYLRMINAAFIELARDPSFGKSCDIIREGYCKFRVGSHVVFYRTLLSEIEVVRVLHQRMDFERHL